MSPLPVLRAQNLFPRPEMNTPPSTDRESAWNFLSRRRKCHFLKWDETVLSGPSHLRPRAPRADAASGGKQKKRPLSYSCSPRRTFAHTCCQKTPSRSCRHHSPLFPDRRRTEQKPGNLLKSQEHPQRETKDKTKVQKK